MGIENEVNKLEKSDAVESSSKSNLFEDAYRSYENSTSQMQDTSNLEKNGTLPVLRLDDCSDNESTGVLSDGSKRMGQRDSHGVESSVRDNGSMGVQSDGSKRMGQRDSHGVESSVREAAEAMGRARTNGSAHESVDSQPAHYPGGPEGQDKRPAGPPGERPDGHIGR